jgi:hypothetical protein
MTNEAQNDIIISSEPRAVQAAPQNAVTPGDLLRHALDSGADLDRLEKLMDLQMRYEADIARKAFADDMARFKARPLAITKDKNVRFKTDKGWTEYDHATIGNVVDVIVPALAEYGFSHRWDLEQKDGQVVVTCVITHRLGHSQSTRLQASPDASGGKNGIQSIISAKTYLERHTLLAATGLATKDQPDDDGELAQARADMPAPGSTQPKQKMGRRGLEQAAEAIKAGTYTLVEIEATHELTEEQRAFLVQFANQSAQGE